MKHFIATFDIETTPGEPRARFVEAAFARCWSNMLLIAGQPAQLPASTLIGDFRDLEDAHRAFDAAIDDASRMIAPAKISIERRYIVERIPAGRLKAPRREWVKTNIARLKRLVRPKRYT